MPTHARPLMERFMEKCIPEPNSGCWLWLDRPDKCGYGHMQLGSRRDGSRRDDTAHAVSYSLFKGKVPAGCEIDHTCHNPSCVNPDHLEAVTHRVNVIRGHIARGTSKLYIRKGFNQ